jgi:hypothetical protein
MTRTSPGQTNNRVADLVVSPKERAEKRALVTQKAAGFLSALERRLALRVDEALGPELFVRRE